LAAELPAVPLSYCSACERNLHGGEDSERHRREE
jgi:hypothetical protein